MEEIRLIENEIAKHRKLLNRAVGNYIIPRINYHHYEIIRLIGGLDKLKLKQMEEPIIGFLSQEDNDRLRKNFIETFQKAEDHFILTGRIPNEKSLET